MPVVYYAEDVHLPDLKKRDITRWIKNIASTYGKRVGVIAYLFCSDSKILDVNRQYLQHDYYTDIITFDYTEGDILSGDIYVSLDTVRSNSEQFQTGYMEELYRVMIHGILHLCGIDDETPEMQDEMTREEDRALASFLPASNNINKQE
jgi:rRNA maturation RNase YbeY